MKLIIVILSLSFSCSVFSQNSVDLRNYFPDIRKQFEGTCYSHGITDLINYELLKSGEKETISPYSVALLNVFNKSSNSAFLETGDVSKFLGLNGGESHEVFNSIKEFGVFSDEEFDITNSVDNILSSFDLEFIHNDKDNSKAQSAFNALYPELCNIDSECRESFASSLRNDYSEISRKEMKRFLKDYSLNYIYKVHSPVGLKEIDQKKIIEKIDKVLVSREKPLYFSYSREIFNFSKAIFNEYSLNDSSHHVSIIVGSVDNNYIIRDSWGKNYCELNRSFYRSIPRSHDSGFNFNSESHILADLLHSIQDTCSHNPAYKSSINARTKLAKCNPIHYADSTDRAECINECFAELKQDITPFIKNEYKNKKLLDKAVKKVKITSDINKALIDIHNPFFQCDAGHFLVPKARLVNHLLDLGYLDKEKDEPIQTTYNESKYVDVNSQSLIIEE